MTKPLLSIVSASLNSGQYIKKAIESVLTQTYPEIEYIVVDGGSTDETLNILKSYGNKIIWISEKDKGIYDALNKGFNLAKGEVLTWLDTDNYYLSNDVVKKVMNEFINDDGLGMVIANTKTVYSDRPEQINQVSESPTFEMFFNKGNKFVPEGVFFKKSLFDSVGGLDIQYKLLADYELWLKMLKSRPKIKKLEITSAAFTVRKDALLRKDPFLAWHETYLIGRKYGWSARQYFYFYLRYLMEKARFFLSSVKRRLFTKK